MKLTISYTIFKIPYQIGQLIRFYAKEKEPNGLQSIVIQQLLSLVEQSYKQSLRKPEEFQGFVALLA